jgi:hypothetical protein
LTALWQTVDALYMSSGRGKTFDRTTGTTTDTKSFSTMGGQTFIVDEVEANEVNVAIDIEVLLNGANWPTAAFAGFSAFRQPGTGNIVLDRGDGKTFTIEIKEN